MKYDFLITYEIKNREIENVCLLKRELERRGYTVKICNMYSTFFETPDPIEAEVVVVSEYYFPHEKYYAASHVTEVKKLVDLRWEQVFNNRDENNPNCTNSIKDWGRDAVHIAWGPFPKNRMITEWQVPEQNIKMTGSITLDFLRGKIRNYYEDKETVFKRYALPLDKRVHLFISSLSYASMDDNRLKNLARFQPSEHITSFADVSKKTQSEILKWFEKALQDNPDDIIIYRPHPEEKGSALLEQLRNKQPRFYVISEESVKQWILICDRIYTWISTSVAEVFAAEKGCTVLRPIDLPYENRMKLFQNTDFITSYSDFVDDFKKENQLFGIPKENIEQYYYIEQNKYSFELVCDALEDVYNNERYLLNEPLKNPFCGGILNKEKLKNTIKCWVAKSKLLNMVYNKNMFKGTKFKYLLDDVMYVREKMKKNKVEDEEINLIIKKINKCFE